MTPETIMADDARPTELEILLDEIVEESRNIERYANDRDAWANRNEASSRNDVQRARTRILELFAAASSDQK